MTARLLGALVLLGALAACGGDDAEPEEHAEAAHWTYDDPDAWGEECATGDRQSPIDLVRGAEEDLADIDFDYDADHVTVANNGHTIMASYPPGRSIAVDGETYELLQFHLHAPSEHTVDGVPAAAELHLVHQADDETLAVVAVLIEEGAAEPDVASMMEQVPAVEGEEVDPGAVDPLALLPDTRRTWRYDGSLTTPPCSEGVKWMVMAEPVTWSADQITAFTELYDGSARPVQPLNDREPVLDATG